MLKIRVIPALLLKEHQIVSSIQFQPQRRRVGDPITLTRIFNDHNADELICMDISSSRSNQPPNFELMEQIANECFVPLTLGGGIRTMADVDRFFKIGADKIALGSIVLRYPQLITEIANKYGSQAVVVGICAKHIGAHYQVFVAGGNVETDYTPEDWAKEVQSRGAGEILLASMDQDGTQRGYDLELLKRVTSVVKVPVIASGGCGQPQDFVDAIQIGGANAVSASSFFYYGRDSLTQCKIYMRDQHLPIRIR